MSAWLSLPAARFAMRQSLGLSHVIPAILVLAGIFVVELPFGRQLAVASAFALVYALPFAATRLIEADRDRRLDHLRLTGHPEGRLLASLALGWSGPWLLVGLVALIVWASAGAIEPTGGLYVAALGGASFTLSLLALSLPRGETGPDARLVAIGLIGITLLASVAPLLALEKWSASGGRTTGIIRAIAMALIVAEAAVSAAALPLVLRTVVRPALAPRTRSPLLRVLAPGRNPALSRAVNLCALAAAYMAGFAVLLLSVLWLALPSEPAEADWLFVHFVVYLPLALCLFVISTGARGDRESGRFDLLRLAPARPLATLVSVAAGACLPFVIATAGLHALVWLFWGHLPRGVLAALVTIAFAAPVAGIEGWLRRWPMVYVLPVVLFVLRGALTQDLSQWWWLALLIWIPWACAVRVFRRPERPPLSGWIGVAATLCLAVLAVEPVVTPLFTVDPGMLCLFLFLLAGLIVSRSSDAFDRWGPGVVSALVAAVVVLKSGQPASAAVVVGLAPLSAWWLAMRVHLATTGAWSFGIRATLVAIFVLQIPTLVRFYGYFGPFVNLRDPARAQWVFRTYVISTALLLIPALLAETAYQIRRRRVPAADAVTRP